jgi:phosphoserine phosphatase RsbU/P
MDVTILVVADCTGHGVPGAFMSMLGTAFLNEIILHKNVLQASHILDSLKQKIIQALSGSSKDIKLSDGMEMSVCIFHNQTNNLEYAGAGLPLVIVRNNELIKIDGDKHNIGKSTVSQPFTNHHIQLFDSDLIYLFSDGYYSQFGGALKSKYSRKKFYSLIMNNASLDISRQYENVEKEFNQWKGESKQIDDILVIGIRHKKSNVIQAGLDFKEKELYPKTWIENKDLAELSLQ